MPSSRQLIPISNQSMPSASQLISVSSHSMPSSRQLITSVMTSSSSQMLTSSSNQTLSSSNHQLISLSGQLLSSSSQQISSSPGELQHELLQPQPMTLHVPHTLSILPVASSIGGATLLEKREMDVAKTRHLVASSPKNNELKRNVESLYMTMPASSSAGRDRNNIRKQEPSVQVTLKQAETIDDVNKVGVDSEEVSIETIEAVEGDDKHEMEVQEFQMFVNDGDEEDGEGTTVIEISEEGRVERMEVVQGSVEGVEGSHRMELIEGDEGMVVEIEEGKVEYLERVGSVKRGRPRKASGGKRRSKSETEEVDQEDKIKESEPKEIEIGTASLVQTEDGEGDMAVVQTEDADGLDSLISVAEAFERSQQPDFNDIASPIVDGTDTDKQLVRNCLLCNKSMLGRNALGRHMKNVHPKVFGPYRCPVPDCPKLLDSGAKLMTHMYSHTGD